ncbi:hypothetical protein ACOME3_002943 [Neoechinorhynchus agilis]
MVTTSMKRGKSIHLAIELASAETIRSIKCYSKQDRLAVQLIETAKLASKVCLLQAATKALSCQMKEIYVFALITTSTKLIDRWNVQGVIDEISIKVDDQGKIYLDIIEVKTRARSKIPVHSSTQLTHTVQVNFYAFMINQLLNDFDQELACGFVDSHLVNVNRRLSGSVVTSFEQYGIPCKTLGDVLTLLLEVTSCVQNKGGVKISELRIRYIDQETQKVFAEKRVEYDISEHVYKILKHQETFWVGAAAPLGVADIEECAIKCTSCEYRSICTNPTTRELDLFASYEE